MTEWTKAQLEEQGYYDDESNASNEKWAQLDKNAAHRESLLPCSRSAGQPLAPKEVPESLTEVERLFPDRERVMRVLAAREELGL